MWLLCSMVRRRTWFPFSPRILLPSRSLARLTTALSGLLCERGIVAVVAELAHVALVDNSPDKAVVSRARDLDVTVMTESAEISDTLLTPELIQAIEQAGNDFEYLIMAWINSGVRRVSLISALSVITVTHEGSLGLSLEKVLNRLVMTLST
jgi:hypothetical protein